MPKKTDNFSKFFNKKRNSAIKEERRQEKKTAKKERKAAIERHFEEKRKLRTQGEPLSKPPSQQQSRPQPQPRPKSRHQPPTQDPVGRASSAPPPSSGRPASIRKGPVSSTPPGRPSPVPTANPVNQHIPARKAPAGPPASRPAPSAPSRPAAPATARKASPPIAAKSAPKSAPKTDPKNGPKALPKNNPSDKAPSTGDHLPLNKYIAHGGICSRRDAAELIRQGKVQVNGQLVTEPGTKVSPKDMVKVNGKKVTMSRNLVYILLNKPKDYITTTEDPQGRRTVLDLIRQATPERVYPVGRLDRNTSGVLLLTNDGELAQKLAHPKHEIKKIYHVTLDKALIKADFEKIVAGVTLEDGPAFVDVIAYADSHDKAQIGLEIHSGRNRIVRRIFEHLGYDVRGLDRVMYAGLTKKNVQRGKWRLLSEKEIRILKYLNNAKTRDHF